VFLLVVLFASGTRVFAQPANNPIFVTTEQVQQLISQALSPIQVALSSLGNRVAGVEAVNASQAVQMSALDVQAASHSAQITDLINHDTSTDESIRNLSSRISSTENSVRLLENTVTDGDFQVSLTNESYPNGFGAWIPKVRIHASWKGIAITDAVQSHGVFSIGGSDYPVIASGVIVSPSVLVPLSSPSGELDLYVFWQGITRHVSTTILAP